MKVRALFISSGREVSYRGKRLRTGIFKEPVAGTVLVDALGLAGDKQCDPRYHGGGDKAVYTYAWEHYLWWAEREKALPRPNAFGENIQTEGLDEAALRPGDRYRFGGAVLEVREPRQPCFKLGIRFGDPGIVKRFKQSERLGMYWAVVEPGPVRAGDQIERAP